MKKIIFFRKIIIIKGISNFKFVSELYIKKKRNNNNLLFKTKILF
jgi:hypothetical protein